MDLPRLAEENLDRRWLFLICLAVFAVSLLLYGPTMKYEFSLYDDYKLIGEHPQLYANGTVAERLKQIVYSDLPREEPLIVRDLTWLADSILFGYNRPFGYHYGNVLYHSLTLVLAFLLLLRLTNVGTALISAALLLVLAAHIEPVAWIMGRKDILSAMFSLASILVFLRFQEEAKTRRRYLFYFASLLFAAAAFLSKVNAVILPGVLFLCALISNRKFMQRGFEAEGVGKSARRLLLQVLPHFVIGLSIFIWYKSVLAEFGLFDNNLDYSWGDYARLVLIVNPLIFVEYLKILLVPWNLEAYYSAPSVFMDFSRLDVAQAILVYVLTPLTVLFLWRLNRVSCLLFLCFLIAMLPYGNWVHFGFWYANRYVYFSGIFLIAALSSALVSIQLRSGARLAKVTLILLLAWTFGHNLYYRSQYLDVWKNGETLWSHEANLPGASIHDHIYLTANYIVLAQNSLADTRMKWLEKARTASDQTFNLQVPAYEMYMLPLAHYYKGLILAYSDAPLESQLQEFRKAAHSSSKSPNAHWSTGVVYQLMAKRETDPDLRMELANNALFHFRKHFEYAANVASVHNYKQPLLRGLIADFPELEIPELQRATEP